MKIADDLRWMNSGPEAGLGEISLPALQPGSSIMPGKVNPIICESMMLICARVIANDVSISIANQRGNFQLNTMLPLIAYDLLQSIGLLARGLDNFRRKAIEGFTINREPMQASLGRNLVLVTMLVPHIGYDRAAEIARAARDQDRSLLEVAREMTSLDPGELQRLLDPVRCAWPNRKSEH
jgi:fumarate hydratase class II